MEGKYDNSNPFSYEKFLWILERDHMFLVDETRFYFNDDADKSEHYLGCLRAFQKPYWVGYCDVPDGCEFDTAYELLNAPIYDGRSLRERWENVVFEEIGGLSVDDWLKLYRNNF